MKKKLIYIIPTLIIIITAITVFLVYSFIPRLTYAYSDTYNGYLVSKAYGISSSYVIPKEYNNKKVVGIGEKAFFSNNKIKEIIFEDPNNIIYIGRDAFYECSNLTTIDLSKVEEIERNAFSYNYNLKDITISAKNIGASAFYKCTSINNIILEEGITSIGSMAFSYTNIKNISLPKSLRNLYVDSLKYLDKLEKIDVYSINYLTNSSEEYLSNFNSIINYI